MAVLDITAQGDTLALAQGIFHRLKADRWQPVEELKQNDPNALVLASGTGVVTLPIPWNSVREIIRRGGKTWVVTDKDVFEGGRSLNWPPSFRLNQAAVSSNGAELWAASDSGLFRFETGGWKRERVLDGLGRAWAVSDVRGVAVDAQGQPWFATKAGVGCRQAVGWKFYEGKDGLPWNDFTGVASGPAGEVWFGTHLGAICFRSGEWHYRQGKAWLPNDDVKQVAVTGSGDAWFVTSGGVGAITRTQMTLAGKAEVYEGEIERYIQRTPYGYVAEAGLRKTADKSSANPDDSDNDGLWTSMYGAGECFAFGATQDPQALKRAKKAFEALRFLQQVTQGGPHSPPKGYVARTIRSVDLPDPNPARVESDKAERERDKLWKAHEPRWPRSADGKWYWKSDTSSDELDGHYFFYGLYNDLCATTPAEKERVREVVRSLTDHIVEHGFMLVDHDGKPTRWGVYGPQVINRDPYWWPERGLNSLSALAYLTVAEHVTGDARYGAMVRELVEKHGYAQNLMFAKVHFGPGSGNQSDDEMAFMCFYSLLRYSKDEVLKNQVRYAFHAYWALEYPEMNPFFNFAHAAINQGQSIDNVWGRFSVAPWSDWHEDSMATLRGFSLDRLGWGRKNSHRLDLVYLGSRHQARDLYEPDRHRRGHRVNGKVIPVENRHFNHWNTDPFDLDYSGDGNELASGTVFLLPYYMGMYHGFIAKP